MRFFSFDGSASNAEIKAQISEEALTTISSVPRNSSDSEIPSVSLTIFTDEISGAPFIQDTSDGFLRQPFAPQPKFKDAPTFFPAQFVEFFNIIHFITS